MRARLFITALCLILSGAGLHSQEYLPAWQEGYMDIHVIATGKGDGTFMVLPDGTTMLVDAGDITGSRFICDPYPDDSKTPGQWIARYIRQFSPSFVPPGNVDYFLLTHFHSDHFGGRTARREGPRYGLCGITDVGEEIHFGKIVDRDYPDYSFPSRETIMKQAGAVMKDYMAFVKYQKDSCGTVAEKFSIGSKKQFALTHNPGAFRKNFEIRNLAASSHIWTGKGLKSRPMYSEDADPTKFDENMNSTVILVRYGKFSFYHGGDLGGSSYGFKAVVTKERNWESQVAELTGPVTVMKADHHGWKDVMNPWFLWKTRPQAVLFQSSHLNHPWKETVRRLTDPQLSVKPELYSTTDAGRSQVGEELFSHIKPTGHIVVRVYEGGSKYRIFILDARSYDYRIIYSTEEKTL